MKKQRHKEKCDSLFRTPEFIFKKRISSPRSFLHLQEEPSNHSIYQNQQNDLPRYWFKVSQQESAAIDHFTEAHFKQGTIFTDLHVCVQTWARKVEAKISVAASHWIYQKWREKASNESKETRITIQMIPRFLWKDSLNSGQDTIFITLLHIYESLHTGL